MFQYQPIINVNLPPPMSLISLPLPHHLSLWQALFINVVWLTITLLIKVLRGEFYKVLQVCISLG